MARNEGEVRETSEKSSAEQAKPKPPRNRRRLFQFMALLLALVPLVLCELALWAFDGGKRSDYEDPFVGFSDINPLFECVGKGVYRTARNRGRFFNTQEFARQKPKDGLRVFALGGSTVRGRPYETDSSFLEWLRVELQLRDSGRPTECVNCGGLSYASYRLVPIVREVLAYEPDAIVVATGHNEFLEQRTYASIANRSGPVAWLQDGANSLRTVTFARSLLKGDTRVDDRETSDEGRTILKADVDAELDRASGYASYHYNKEWREQVVQHFDASLRTMIQLCDDAGVPLILVRLASNIRDCPPFKSEHVPDLPVEVEQEWARLFQQGDRAETSEEALGIYQQCEKLAPEHALLAFRMARALDRLGQPDAARKYYERAREWDICPLRKTQPLDDVLVQICAETNTPLVDSQTWIEAQSADGIPGNDWFMDHVHPNIAVHQQIAQMLANKMEEMQLAETTSVNRSARRQAYRDHFEKTLGGSRWLADGGRRVQWLENWAQRQRLFHEGLPFSPREHLDYAQRAYDFNDPQLAWDSYQTALEKDPESSARRILNRARFLMESGRPYDSADLLEMLLDANIDAELKNAVRFAALIVCVELPDAKTAAVLLAECKDRKVPPDAEAWAALMPDVFEQADRLIAEAE